MAVGIVDHLLPVLVALAGLAIAVVWQVAAFVLLRPVVHRGVGDAGFADALAWTLTPAVMGGFAAWLVNLGVARWPILPGLGLAVLGGGLWTWCRCRSQEIVWRSPRDPAEWLLVALGGVLALYAAHPQWHYDQYAYHLNVARRILEYGDPRVNFIDPHLFVAGSYEFALTWLGVLGTDEILFIAAAQAYTLVVAGGGLILGSLAWYRRSGESFEVNATVFGWLFGVSFVLVFPDGSLFFMTKSGAITLAAWFALLAYLQPTPERGVPRDAWATTIGVAALTLSLKIVVAHAILAIGASLLLLRVTERPTWRHLLLPSAGGLILGGIVWFRIASGVTPLYPRDVAWWPTTHDIAVLHEYWDAIANPAGEGVARRWLGPLKLVASFPALLVFAVLCWGVGRWTRASRSGRWLSRKDPVVLYVVMLALTWPLFYSSHATARFVTPLVAGLYVILLGLVARVPPGRWRGGALGLFGLLALVSSRVEVKLIKLGRFNQSTSYEALATMLPELPAGRWLNAQVGSDAMVVSNEGTKYFLAADLLSNNISPATYDQWQWILGVLERDGQLPSAIDAVIHNERVDMGQVDARFAAIEANHVHTRYFPPVLNYVADHWRKRSFGPVHVYLPPSHVSPP